CVHYLFGELILGHNSSFAQRRKEKSEGAKSILFNLQISLADETAFAADAHGLYFASLLFNHNLDDAGASHLYTLLAGEFHSLRHRENFIARKVATERPAGRASRGVFLNAQTGGEHARVNH